MQNKIIAVDFDGTLCLNMYPNIGDPRRMVIRYILNEQKHGAKLILWTNRTDDQLKEAVDWCRAQGIVFDAINENLPETIEFFGGDTRKIVANEYLDDRAVTPESAILRAMQNPESMRK